MLILYGTIKANLISFYLNLLLFCVLKLDRTLLVLLNYMLTSTTSLRTFFSLLSSNSEGNVHHKCKMQMPW